MISRKSPVSSTSDPLRINFVASLSYPKIDTSLTSKAIHPETPRNFSACLMFQVLVSPGLFSQFSFYPSAGKSFSKASLNDYYVWFNCEAFLV